MEKNIILDKQDASNNYLTPHQIVTELNKYVIGQDEAKKSVAIALILKLSTLLIFKSLFIFNLLKPF